MEKPLFDLCVKKGPGVPDVLDAKALGLFLCAGPKNSPGTEEDLNSYFKLNFAGQLGAGSNLYFSLVGSLAKWGWQINKADEWIDVLPTHKEYYERTTATKQMLESTIKTGLTSAAQAVADFELMSHDLRKYKEILNYFQADDNNLLRSMFVDQVDVHTDLPGQPVALRTIVSRWPTIIADFNMLKDSDTDPKDISDKYDISRAEAVILSTKNKLFVEWKNMFKQTAKDRYQRLRGLVASRKKTIEEYKEWLKPYIARFKMTRLGGERPGVRSGALRTFVDITGMSTFNNQIRLFIWKPMKFPEHNKPHVETKDKFIINPYDDYVREKMIINKETGLAHKDFYPWLRNTVKYCPKCKSYLPHDAIRCKNDKCKSVFLEERFYADQIVEEEILPNWNSENGLSANELYYMFIDMVVDRSGMRLQTGEFEDITFDSKIFVLSQNIMLVKILELWCRDKEMENYIDEMLGVKFEDMDIEELIKEELPGIYGKKDDLDDKEKRSLELAQSIKGYTGLLKGVKVPKPKSLAFLKRGPYERDFKDRITKHYLKYASSQLGSISGFLKGEMGVG